MEVAYILKKLGIDTKGISWGMVTQDGLANIIMSGPFTALQMVNLYAEFEKVLNPDKANRKYHFEVRTTLLSDKKDEQEHI